MRRSQRIRPTAAAIAVAALGAVTLAGCGAGQITQTSRQVSAVNGAGANVGPIAIRNAQFVLGEKQAQGETGVAYTRGANAPLEMVIVNTGAGDDALVSASSPAASSVIISGPKALPGGRSLVVVGPPGSSQDTAPEQPAPATGTPAATPAPSTPAGTPVTAPDELSQTAQVVLTGLRDDVHSGITYPVTLTFQKAGTVTVPVPVAISDAPRKDVDGLEKEGHN